MIIRRKYTANFTTIGNEVFDDERLALDELGLLCYLRSKPHDWEVRRPALRRRFKIGRDGMRRMIRSLIRFGWIGANVTRLADGRVFIIYEVRDDPGPELTDEEAKAALSLVSSDAAQASSDDDSEDGEQPADGGDPPGDRPADGRSAGGGQPPPDSPPPPYRDSTKTESVKTESTNRARAFADVKTGWPPENILSEAASQRAFLALSDADKEACFHGERPYLADCNRQARKVCDLRTYIEERRWERFQSSGQAKATLYVAKVGTPQFYRWKEHLTARGEWGSKERLVRDYGAISVSSEWPPASDIQKAG